MLTVYCGHCQSAIFVLYCCWFEVKYMLSSGLHICIYISINFNETYQMVHKLLLLLVVYLYQQTIIGIDQRINVCRSHWIRLDFIITSSYSSHNLSWHACRQLATIDGITVRLTLSGLLVGLGLIYMNREYDRCQTVSQMSKCI